MSDITPAEAEWLEEAAAILRGKQASDAVRRKAAVYVARIAKDARYGKPRNHMNLFHNPDNPDAIAATVRHIRDNDCDFLTVETIMAYTGCDEDSAHAALVEVLGVSIEPECDCPYPNPNAGDESRSCPFHGDNAR